MLNLKINGAVAKMHGMDETRGAELEKMINCSIKAIMNKTKANAKPAASGKPSIDDLIAAKEAEIAQLKKEIAAL